MATDMMNSLTSLAAHNAGGSPSAGTDVAAIQGQVVANGRSAAGNVTNAKVSKEAVDRVVSDLKDYVQSSRRNLDFQVDDVTGRVVVKVIDANSNTVIRQIPSEEILALSRRLAESLDNAHKGMLLEIKA